MKKHLLEFKWFYLVPLAVAALILVRRPIIRCQATAITGEFSRHTICQCEWFSKSDPQIVYCVAEQ